MTDDAQTPSEEDPHIGLPPDDVITNTLNSILRTNDLEKLTLRMVMSMLSETLSVHPAVLAPKKKFVRSTISSFLETSYEPEPEEQPSVETKSNRGPKRKSGQTPGQPPKPVRLTGLEKAVVLAEPLANFLGMPVISRSQIPKRISLYAKEKDLQDPADRRTVICDDALRAALNVDKFTFFQLAKRISGLVYKPEECSEELQQLARECEEKAIEEKTKRKAEEAANGIEPKQKRRKKKKDASEDPPKKKGAQKPMQLSPELSAVCGEDQLSRAEVVKKIREYVRENELEDEDSEDLIQCDDKLKAIFQGQSTVDTTGINKFIGAHMTKI